MFKFTDVTASHVLFIVHSRRYCAGMLVLVLVLGLLRTTFHVLVLLLAWSVFVLVLFRMASSPKKSPYFGFYNKVSQTTTICI